MSDAVQPVRVPVKLPGLPYILHARNINRPTVAKVLGVELRRVYALCNVSSRAEPWEIDKLKDALSVTLDELTTIPPDAPPLPPKRRAFRRDAARSDDQTAFTHVEITESDSEPSQESEQVVTIPKLVGEVSLSITLPNGHTFSVTSNQTTTPKLLERMARALSVLADL